MALIETYSWRRPVAVLVTAGLVAGAGWWWFAALPVSHAGKASEVLHCAMPPQAKGSPQPGMVWVPAGRFDMGDSTYPEEQPTLQTSVTGFWIDRTEVTNDEFAAFVKATGYLTTAERAVDEKHHPGLPPEMRKPGAVVFTVPQNIDTKGDISQWWRYVPGANWRHPGGPHTSIEGRGAFPVVTVTYDDARAYAKWKGRELPSEAQWEWAARGARDQASDPGQPKDANTWQGLFPLVNSGADGFVGLAPVGCYPANALGMFDTIGNVWELTSDAWQPTHQSPGIGHPDQVPANLRNAANGQRVIKGGSFLCAPNYCMRYRAGARQPQEEDLAVSHLGFRTVSLAPGP